MAPGRTYTAWYTARGSQNEDWKDGWKTVQSKRQKQNEKKMQEKKWWDDWYKTGWNKSWEPEKEDKPKTPEKDTDIVLTAILEDSRSSIDRFTHKMKTATGKTYEYFDKMRQDNQDSYDQAIAQKMQSLPAEERTTIQNNQVRNMEASLARNEKILADIIDEFEALDNKMDAAFNTVDTEKKALAAYKEKVAAEAARSVPTAAPIQPPAPAMDENAIRMQLLGEIQKQKAEGKTLDDLENHITNLVQIKANEETKPEIQIQTQAPPTPKVKLVLTLAEGGLNKEVPGSENGDTATAPAEDPEILKDADGAEPDEKMEADAKRKAAVRAAQMERKDKRTKR